MRTPPRRSTRSVRPHGAVGRTVARRRPLVVGLPLLVAPSSPCTVAHVVPGARPGDDRVPGPRRVRPAHPADRAARADRRVPRPGQPPRPAQLLPAGADVPAARVDVVGAGGRRPSSSTSPRSPPRCGSASAGAVGAAWRPSARCWRWRSAATGSCCSPSRGTRTCRCSPWIVVLLAAWAVLCGDTLMLVPLVVAAIVVRPDPRALPRRRPAGWCSLALGARRLRAGRHEPAAPTRCVAAAAVIGVVLWLPPVVDQLTNDPGNVRKLLDHFGSPPEPALGFGDGVRLALRHLDVWAGFAGQLTGDRPLRRRRPRRGAARWCSACGWSPPSSPGASGSRALQRAPRRGRRRPACSVPSSMARIFGRPWYYLTLWAWGIDGARCSVPSRWTALALVAPPRSPAGGRAPGDAVALVGAARRARSSRRWRRRWRSPMPRCPRSGSARRSGRSPARPTTRWSTGVGAATGRTAATWCAGATPPTSAAPASACSTSSSGAASTSPPTSTSTSRSPTTACGRAPTPTPRSTWPPAATSTCWRAGARRRRGGHVRAAHRRRSGSSSPPTRVAGCSSAWRRGSRRPGAARRHQPVRSRPRSSAVGGRPGRPHRRCSTSASRWPCSSPRRRRADPMTGATAGQGR